jgi:tetratricopeptide (TPR) repeat protein
MEWLKKIGRWIQEVNLTTIFFWVLAFASGVAAFLLLKQEKPPGTAILSLLIWAGICLVLATGGIQRIQRIGPGGVEFETWRDIERILSTTRPPLPHWSLLDRLTRGEPFPNPFSHQQSWFYERAVSIIFHLEHRGVDPSTFSKTNLKKYRELIVWAGVAALNVNYAKSLDILQQLEPIEPKDFKELYYLGLAYLMEAHAEKDPQKRKSGLEKASRLFGEAIRKYDKDPDVFLNLGWIYDELGLYEESIKANQKVLDLDQRLAPLAWWTMAVSFLKQNKTEASLNALNSIPEGSWWQEIYDDPELASLKKDPKFHEFYNSRKEKAGTR